jgi:hypothetical protein
MTPSEEDTRNVSECGLEKTLERKLPESERRWVVKELSDSYSDKVELDNTGWPDIRPET